MVLARPDEREACLYHCFAPLYDGQEVFVWSGCLLDLGYKDYMMLKEKNGIRPQLGLVKCWLSLLQ